MVIFSFLFVVRNENIKLKKIVLNNRSPINLASIKKRSELKRKYREKPPSARIFEKKYNLLLLIEISMNRKNKLSAPAYFHDFKKESELIFFSLAAVFINFPRIIVPAHFPIYNR